MNLRNPTSLAFLFYLILTRWREQGVLSIYMQRRPSTLGGPTDLHVLEFSLSAPN